MKLGPNSLNAATSRWPGRGRSGTCRRANGRPSHTNRSAAGMSASGNNASCRARITQILTRRAKLRRLRRGPNLGRSGSEAPSRMERSDAPRQIAKLDLVESGLGDHLGEVTLPREAPDAFDEIGIGVTVTGDDLAEQRNDLKAVEVVKWLKEGGNLGGEFQAKKMPTRLQHTFRLGEREIETGDIPQPETDRVEIDTAVGHRKPFGIGAQPLDPAENPLVESPGASDREHRLADIANENASAFGVLVRNEARQGAQCDIAGTAGDIEKTLPRTRLQPGHHLRFPPAVDTDTHQIVH